MKKISFLWFRFSPLGLPYLICQGILIIFLRFFEFARIVEGWLIYLLVRLLKLLLTLLGVVAVVDDLNDCLRVYKLDLLLVFSLFVSLIEELFPVFFEFGILRGEYLVDDCLVVYLVAIAIFFTDGSECSEVGRVIHAQLVSENFFKVLVADEAAGAWVVFWEVELELVAEEDGRVQMVVLQQSDYQFFLKGGINFISKLRLFRWFLNFIIFKYCSNEFIEYFLKFFGCLASDDVGEEISNNLHGNRFPHSFHWWLIFIAILLVDYIGVIY